MENREPCKLVGFIRAYNIFQIIACLYVNWCCIYTGFWKHLYTCEGFDPNDHEKIVKSAWLAMMLRLADFIETCVYVLRKKHNQISFLHVYHHIIVMIGFYVGINTGIIPILPFLLMINTSIHFVMYCYYFFSTFNAYRTFLRKIKPILTTIQILQLVFFCYSGFNEMKKCKNVYPPDVVNFGLVLVSTLIILFFNYFYQNFHKKKINFDTGKKTY